MTDTLDQRRRRRHAQSLARAAVAAAAIAIMVIGIPLRASAATSTYWNGQTLRNQTITSPTASMTGGYVSVGASTGFIQTRATVYGIGSFTASAPGGSYSHARLTTSVYCQWRADDIPFPNPIPTGTKYNLTCQYNY